MGKKKVPAMNTSSTADIAFLLLCYFLMTTTMGSQTGLSRRLPPMPDQNQKVEDQKVNRRNIIQVKINSADRILAGSEPIDISQLKDKIKEFLSNPADDPNLPEKEIQNIEGLGDYPVSKGIISLQNDRGTSYQAYIMRNTCRIGNTLHNQTSICQTTHRRFTSLADTTHQNINRFHTHFCNFFTNRICDNRCSIWCRFFCTLEIISTRGGPC